MRSTQRAAFSARKLELVIEDNKSNPTKLPPSPKS
jgi:hypothetical protein